MKKEPKSKKLIIGLVALLMIIVIILAYFFLMDNKIRVELTNPLSNLSDEEAVRYFNETFISYLLYTIEADELHKPPLSQDTPKIEIRVEDTTYNAEIKDKRIYVKKGEIEGKDVIITTNKQEAVKMLRNSEYITESFQNGLSTIELAKSKTNLLAKGYWNIYELLS